ncbi:ornithine carbamoyltransferase [Naumannella sp. ID2617S]|uniref:Ornithine carbamoyltransferase n=1 Tax=Enemella dayhoffiae TaxID=2016507 RepID=A0A255H3A1_9ACTN|nr:ornithine carbamoyltransferase [Enemella dayhoffiae]NNG19485.1 ornithine carbamoyltransferase [Naumannella sp. ID2617S]OYO22117.1 ornithine carbamoyltransferase [Enemella dayhoffiae]
MTEQPKHFLADDDLSAAEQAEVLDLSARMKQDPFGFRPLEGPRSVAVLTDKPTLRTQVSFHAAIAELGGNPMLVDGRLAGVGVRETIPDVTRVLSRHVAAIVWRTGPQQRIEEMAAASSVPVINALTDDYHPCQVLADWQTIIEHKGSLQGLSFAYVGDGANNMANSYLLAGALAGMRVRIGAPADYHPAAEVLTRAEAIADRTGGSILVTDSATEAVSGADVVCTDTWVSMGQEGQDSERVQAFAPYSVTETLVSGADSDAIVMHCLPAYRGKEIEASVLEGPRSVVFDEAENRRHAQKALLAFLLQSGDRAR